MTAHTLSMSAAVELAHAQMQRLAEQHGIRVLFIKGPVLAHQGLRPVWQSTDVDLLVDPSQFDEFCRVIVDSGWQERPGIEALTVIHSRTYLHAHWPCDIDPHVYFPGFLASPQAVFEEMWARRTTMSLAHYECDVTDRLSSLLIMGLHSLRGSSRSARHVEELEIAGSLSLSAEDLSELAALARATGATATAQPFLQRLGIRVEPTEAELRSEEYLEWTRRSATASHGAYPWLVAFRRGSWRQRGQLLWHVIWPSAAELRRARPEIGDSRWAGAKGRIARWARGLRSLPGGVRLLRSRRH